MPFDITKLDSQTIIFGGLTLISLALVWLVYKLVTNHFHHTNNVIDKNTSAWVENAKSNQKLIDVIDKYHAKEKI